MFLSGTNDAEVNMRKTILKDGSGAEDVFDAMERYVRAVEEHLKRISGGARLVDVNNALSEQRIIKRLLTLKANPRPQGAKKLGGGDRYRIRVGDYRVLYTIDDALQKIEVSAVGHRREVYRKD